MHQNPRPPTCWRGMDLLSPFQLVERQRLLHAISLNPAAISTGHSYAAPSRSTTDESTTQSKPLITIPSHSKSVSPMDTEMRLLPLRFSQLVVTLLSK